MLNVETIESLLPNIFAVAEHHNSETVKNAAAIAVESLLLLLDLDAEQGNRMAGK